MKKFVRFIFPAVITIFILFSSFDSFTPLWSSGTNILKPVRAGNTASYSKNNNGWMIIVSGRDQNEAITKTVQRYNVNSNTWDTLDPHPTGLLGAATAILKDSLYIIGGIVSPPGAGQEIVYKYSINQNTWSTVASLPVTLVDAKGVSYQDSLIYTAGGFGGPSAGNVFLYNSNSNSWRTATPFPSEGRRNFGGFAIAGDTLIYMCGTNAFGSSVYFDSVYVGVISQNDRSVINWTRGANFPGQTRTFFDACNWGSHGIIMTGGSTDNTFNTASNECYSFSPGRNQWTQLPNKPTAWLTGQSGSVMLGNNIWKLICASGYNSGYLSQTEILTDTLLSVGISQINSMIPEKFTLGQNFPNPFNPATNLEFGISDWGLVTLKVYDLLGKEVATLVNERLNAGTYKYNFDGSQLTSGIYFYTLKAGEFTATKSMLLIK
ncbi:MAG: T9SS type A sorting domain-containing protein [Ignavibacteria bacterium]|nr:T9SS type A sorting domain-containing protein [Ignavibacteria bacterium]